MSKLKSAISLLIIIIFFSGCQTVKEKTDAIVEKEKSNYTNIDAIREEVEKAKEIFKKYNWPTIDVTRKSVEETAASIIKIHEIYKNNDK